MNHIRIRMAMVIGVVSMLVAAAALVPNGSPALGNHIAGATYTGTFLGGTVEFDVSADGTKIVEFRAFTGTVETRFPITVIENHAFSNSLEMSQPGTDIGLSISGSFPTASTSEGTFSMTLDGPPLVMNWIASTTAAPPASATPAAELTMPGDVDCDDEVDSGDAMKIAQWIAGLSINQEPGCPAIGAASPVPSPVPTPPTPTPTPTGQDTSFGNGTFIVGTDIAPGIYRNSSSAGGCYWERLSGFGGTIGDVIANEFTSAIQTVKIKPTDASFSSNDCSTWSQNLAPPSSGPTQPFGPGVWLVGEEIAPGMWRNDDSSDGCYWERRSGLGGTFGEIIANEYSSTIQTVSIHSGDVAFDSLDCGTWTKIG